MMARDGLGLASALATLLTGGCLTTAQDVRAQELSDYATCMKRCVDEARSSEAAARSGEELEPTFRQEPSWCPSDCASEYRPNDNDADDLEDATTGGRDRTGVTVSVPRPPSSESAPAQQNE
jgi:hypothetical protein